MNLKAVNFYRRIIFLLILTIGLCYGILLIVFTQKVFSGFAMQFIYVINALTVAPSSLFSLVIRRDFIIPTLAGLVWIYLLFLTLKSLITGIHRFFITNKFVRSLKIIKKLHAYSIVDLPAPEVFTAGLFFPRIYVSSRLINLSTSSELESIVFHELSHVHHRDPLKNLVVSTISQALPDFIGKTFLFGYYRTLVELGCDSYSRSRISHPTALISALLKIQQHFPPSNVLLSHFSAQSERIRVLVGQKKPPFVTLLAGNLAMITFLVVSTSFLIHTDLFYQCQHLALCFVDLFAVDHLPTAGNVGTHLCNLN